MGGPYNKDHSIWGSIFGSPCFGKLPCLLRIGNSTNFQNLFWCRIRLIYSNLGTSYRRKSAHSNWRFRLFQSFLWPQAMRIHNITTRGEIRSAKGHSLIKQEASTSLHHSISSPLSWVTTLVYQGSGATMRECHVHNCFAPRANLTQQTLCKPQCKHLQPRYKPVSLPTPAPVA